MELKKNVLEDETSMIINTGNAEELFATEFTSMGDSTPDMWA